ncbi:MAG: T9SS type A sorting domain-containing protein, partial [Saprospiraceae bacterium]|nr:T9SS type A sorting domain-containing protein [Saprospiraceae bacterium]
MSRVKGLAYIDTVLMFYTPRACAALGLTECLDALGVVSVQELPDDNLVEMQVGPNPSSEEIHFRTSLEHPMEEIRVFNLNGLMVQAYPAINSSQHTLSRRNLPPGIYLARIRFNEGILTRKIVFR